MAEDRFARDLDKRRQISISVTGRHSGRTITRPVWFVAAKDTLWLLPVYGSQTQWYQNLVANPAITIQVGSERCTLRAETVREARAVRRVIRRFGERYTPKIIERLYKGPLNVAVKVKLQHPERLTLDKESSSKTSTVRKRKPVTAPKYRHPDRPR